MAGLDSRQMRAALAVVAAVAWAGGQALWRALAPAVGLLFKSLLAIVLVFEEWGWQPLAALIARLARFKAWARLELWIAGLPPYGALATFAGPAVLLLPVKFLALYLFATGHTVLGVMLLGGAKLVGTALVARIFALTKPQLMRIAWFAWAYERFMPWKTALVDWLHETRVWRVARAVAHRGKRGAQAAWGRLKPRMVEMLARLRPQVIVLARGVRRWVRSAMARVGELLSRSGAAR